MTRLSLVLASAALLLTLTACGGFTIIVNPPANAIARDANLDDTTPVATVTLAAGDEQAYALTLPSAVRAEDVLYVELDDAVNLTVYDRDGYRIATSSTPSVFAAGGLGLAAAPAPAPQEVDVTYPCRGSCVLVPADTSKVYAKVENNSGSSLTLHLFAYGARFHDVNDPGNDTTTGATPLYAGSDSGALETLGDVDVWNPDGAHGLVTFDSVTSPVGFVAEIVYDNGARVPGTVLHYPGDPAFDVYSGEYLKITSDNDYAGSTAKSTYYLSYSVLN